MDACCEAVLSFCPHLFCLKRLIVQSSGGVVLSMCGGTGGPKEVSCSFVPFGRVSYIRCRAVPAPDLVESGTAVAYHFVATGS